MTTKIKGNYEWDDKKNNIHKHKLSFSEILPVFDDPLFMEKLDSDHSSDTEIRYIGIGKIYGTVVIVTCYTPRGKRTRIINARISTKREEKLYEEKCRQIYSWIGIKMDSNHHWRV